MGTRHVINIILLLSLIASSNTCIFSQIKDTIHLSFNILENDDILQLHKMSGSEVNIFNINNNQFHQIKNSKVCKIAKEKITRLELIQIAKLNELASEEISRQVKIGEETGIVKVLSDHTVFDNLFLYYKNDMGEYFRYSVVWDKLIE